MLIEFLAGAFTTGMILLAIYARHLENDIRRVEEWKKKISTDKFDAKK